MGEVIPFPAPARRECRDELARILDRLSDDAHTILLSLMRCQDCLARLRILPEAQIELLLVADKVQALVDHFETLSRDLPSRDTGDLSLVLLGHLARFDEIEDEANRVLLDIAVQAHSRC